MHSGTEDFIVSYLSPANSTCWKYITYLTAYKTHFFPKGLPENYPVPYTAKRQHFVSGLWKFTASVNQARNIANFNNTRSLLNQQRQLLSKVTIYCGSTYDIYKITHVRKKIERWHLTKHVPKTNPLRFLNVKYWDLIKIWIHIKLLKLSDNGESNEYQTKTLHLTFVFSFFLSNLSSVL